MLKFWRNLAISLSLVLLAQRTTACDDCCGDSDTSPSVIASDSDTSPSVTDSTTFTTSASISVSASQATASGSDDKGQAVLKVLEGLGAYLEKTGYTNMTSDCEPSMKSSNKRADSTSDDCVPFSEAAGPIAAGFDTWKLSSVAEKAGAMAWMIYESKSFTYKLPLNHTQAELGKGTSNMQSGDFNVKYAKALSDFGNFNSSDPGAVVEKLVTKNEWTFGSASWFISTQDDPKHYLASDDATEDDYENYVTKVISTSSDLPERKKIFTYFSDAFKTNNI